MIIGVDESGDFRLGSRALFVGVFIRPSERDGLVDAYRAWERDVRRDLGLRNELKGYAITDAWARALVRDVLTAKGRQPVRYLAFAVDVSEANLDSMEAQRRIFLEDYRHWADDLRASDNRKGASSVERHAEWIRVRPPVQILKLVTLGTILTTLIEWAMPQAILGGFDHELEHLQVLIDRGYVKQDDIPRWREVLRNAIINESHTHPLATLDTWTDDHPFLRKFIDRGGDGATLLRPAFGEMINFYDSQATPEVRIADVVASLIHRATIKGEELRSYPLIRELSLEPELFRLIVWTSNRRAPIENPYLSFERDDG